MAETIHFEIVTPARLMLGDDVHLVVLPGEDGNLGVLPRHTPLLTSLRPGTIEILDEKMKLQRQIFVEQGFADVTPERCTVLAEEAIPVEQITREAADARLKRAADALLVADTASVRLGAERELRAAEAMSEALDAYEKAQNRAS
jgi:F-type H+-transporting ATPase subunit epsilon